MKKDSQLNSFVKEIIKINNIFIKNRQKDLCPIEKIHECNFSVCVCVCRGEREGEKQFFYFPQLIDEKLRKKNFNKFCLLWPLICYNHDQNSQVLLYY